MLQEKLNYKNKMEAYIYTYVNKESGKTYIGSRSHYTGKAEDDFNIKYFSSSKDTEFKSDMHNGKLDGQIILKINCQNAKQKITLIEEKLIIGYWNKYGKHLSYNHQARGKWNTGGMKMKHTLGMTGKHHSDETKEKMKINGKHFKPGNIPWNKGLTKENDARVLNYSKTLSERKIGHTPWNKGKKCHNITGELNGMFGKHHSIEARKKISESFIKYKWLNKETNEIRIMDIRHATRYLKNWIKID